MWWQRTLVRERVRKVARDGDETVVRAHLAGDLLLALADDRGEPLERLLRVMRAAAKQTPRRGREPTQRAAANDAAQVARCQDEIRTCDPL